MDIASESGAALSKAAPSRDTAFAPASLMRSMVRSVSEISIVSSNAMVITPVFSFKDA